ncbi:MAG: protein kinase [Victivallales bacterium]|nr:protein kinase [Victivallales bacterium]
MDREATVKIIKNGGCSQEILDDFLSSARKQATISNSCIASIYGCGTTEEGVYVVSQYTAPVEWPSAEWRENSCFLNLAADLIGAVAEAAKAGVHHGNLCPANILINPEKDLLVTDFGSAVALGTEPGAFAAPERKAGSPATVEEDVYSMGACIYYMATGVIPEKGSIKPIGELKKGLPFNVVESIMKMLSEEPAKRPVNLTELASVFRGSGEAVLKPVAKKRLKRSGAVHVKVVRAPRKKVSLLNVLLVIAFVAALCLGGIYIALGKQESSRSGGEIEKNTVAVENKANLDDGVNAGGYVLPAECLNARPRPADLDFKQMKEKNQNYLKLVPPDKQEIEKERLRLVGGSLDFLKDCMKGGAYNRADDYPIRLKDGSVIKGIIPYAPNKENLVTIRRPNDQDAVKIPFASLEFLQMMDILKFYAEKREEMALGKLNRLMKGEIYNIYLRTALLCDWYEKPEEAKKCIALALKYRPQNKKEILKFGLPLPAEEK